MQIAANPLTSDSPISDLERTLDTICSFPLRCMQPSTARKDPSPLASPSPSTATQNTNNQLHHSIHLNKLDKSFSFTFNVKIKPEIWVESMASWMERSYCLLLSNINLKLVSHHLRNAVHELKKGCHVYMLKQTKIKYGKGKFKHLTQTQRTSSSQKG